MRTKHGGGECYILDKIVGQLFAAYAVVRKCPFVEAEAGRSFVVIKAIRDR